MLVFLEILLRICNGRQLGEFGDGDKSVGINSRLADLLCVVQHLHSCVAPMT